MQIGLCIEVYKNRAMTDPIRPAVIEFFRRTACETPQDISALFSEDVDWHVAGDVDAVSWIGRKTGRKGVAEFYQAIRDLIVSERFEVTEILVQGNRAIALGELESRVKSTGKLIVSEFAFDLTFRDGLIVRFRMFEDSFAVARAAV